MSRYGNHEKENLFDDMFFYVENNENGVSELLRIVSDVVAESYYKSVEEKERELETLYGDYKRKLCKIEEMF